jgi:hypothetical protein
MYQILVLFQNIIQGFWVVDNHTYLSNRVDNPHNNEELLS